MCVWGGGGVVVGLQITEVLSRDLNIRPLRLTEFTPHNLLSHLKPKTIYTKFTHPCRGLLLINIINTPYQRSGVSMIISTYPPLGV